MFELSSYFLSQFWLKTDKRGGQQEWLYVHFKKKKKEKEKEKKTRKKCLGGGTSIPAGLQNFMLEVNFSLANRGFVLVLSP